MYKKLLATYCIAFAALVVNAQNVPVTKIKVLAKSKNTGVWIRWAPVNHTVWQLGNKFGYTIERFTVKSDGALENKTSEKLVAAPLKPLPENEMEKLSEQTEEISVMQELLYGEGATKKFEPNNLGSVMKRNRELENSFGIALLMCDISPAAAKAAALFFEDNTAIIGKRYIYQISIAESLPNIDTKTGVIVIDHTIEKPLLLIKDLEATFGDHSVTLSWPVAFHRGVYSAYYIEKSSDGKKFERITDLPYVHMTQKMDTENAHYKDSLVLNNKTFYYRIIGISAFGELSVPSTSVSGKGVDNLAGLLIIRQGKVLEKNKINVAWDFPLEAEKVISGYILMRANNPAGPYTDVNKKLIAPYKREYTDETPFNNTYYQLKAVNKAGMEVAKSFAFHTHLEDNEPPAAPIDLSGKIDKDGIVTLSWKANTEKDMMAYRVFMSNSLESEQVEATHTFNYQTDFKDTININVLNKKAYYFVVAVDKNYNNSDYSKPLLLVRPDLIAPAAPVFTKMDYDSKSIILEWINSASDDVANYELFRSSNSDTVKTKIVNWDIRTNKTAYTDEAVTLGKTYWYTLKAYDSSANASQTISKEIFFETGVRNAVKDFTTSVDRETRTIKLQWEKQSQAQKYIIYRRKNEDIFRIYKTFEHDTLSFDDKDVKISNAYYYKFQVIYPSGVRSEISKEFKVAF